MNYTKQLYSTKQIWINNVNEKNRFLNVYTTKPRTKLNTIESSSADYYSQYAELGSCNMNTIIPDQTETDSRQANIEI